MIPSTDSHTPDSGDEISLVLTEGGVEYTIENFGAYHFRTHLMQPTSSFSLTMTDDRISQNPALTSALVPGSRVSLICNQNTLATGRVDSVHHTYSREGGQQITIDGRDLMGQCVDACLNPRKFKFNPGQSLFDIATAVFADYGIGTFEVDNDANRNLITGQTRGTKYTRAKKASKVKPLKSYQINEQVKPHDHEGAYQFINRLAKRFGVHFWLSADGKNVIFAKPDFDQAATYKIIHKTDGSGHNNVLQGDVIKNATEQPHYIVATGFGAGGTHPYGSLRCIAQNEILCYDKTGKSQIDLAAVKSDHPKANVLDVRPFSTFPPDAYLPFDVSRPVYMHDDESRSMEQLMNFVRRELALRQRQALVAIYEFDGHTNNGSPWGIDSIAAVDDDTGNVHGNLYVLAVEYMKSRGGGTKTRVELILPHTLEF